MNTVSHTLTAALVAAAQILAYASSALAVEPSKADKLAGQDARVPDRNIRDGNDQNGPKLVPKKYLEKPRNDAVAGENVPSTRVGGPQIDIVGGVEVPRADSVRDPFPNGRPGSSDTKSQPTLEDRLEGNERPRSETDSYPFPKSKPQSGLPYAPPSSATNVRVNSISPNFQSGTHSPVATQKGTGTVNRAGGEGQGSTGYGYDERMQKAQADIPRNPKGVSMKLDVNPSIKRSKVKPNLLSKLRKDS